MNTKDIRNEFAIPSVSTRAGDPGPFVSICIPTYNSARYLRACLDSIVSQTYKHCEIIISDNNSSDDTSAIIQEYASRYGFRYYRNEQNIGPTANFNRLLGLATGEYIAIYHADDVYERTIVEECVSVLRQDTEIGLVGTLGTMINDKEERYYSMQLPKAIAGLNKMSYDFDEALSAIVQRGWFFLTPTIMFRNTILQKAGTFDALHFRTASDYELFLRIARTHRVAIINRSLISYRIHAAQHTESAIRKNLDVADIVLVLREYRQYANHARTRKLCDICIAGNIVKTGRRQNYYGLYEKSSATLRSLTVWNVHWSLVLQKYSILLLNKLGVSFKKRTLPQTVL
jgi:glycosyltransferase involved in cell wall biosynthesis